MAEGLVDAAIVRRAAPTGRFDSALVGIERRVTAFPAEDRWAGRRKIRSDAPAVEVRLVWHRGEHTPAIAKLRRMLTELYAA
ncbi:hypothetical protein [Nesterenkonia lutea]|uniref:LysR substrate-binding domain-containing protein n=1 Tax=Nesterenkonia lutea TaxID=272919 RepID=A0ABR9JDL7_9MICC|nr:hypothetical protein [Nesterenkonia lutea]MBE1524031.1 hypothetical protein [Nesterenkonia lutea]